jgi:integrase
VGFCLHAIHNRTGFTSNADHIKIIATRDQSGISPLCHMRPKYFEPAAKVRSLANKLSCRYSSLMDKRHTEGRVAENEEIMKCKKGTLALETPAKASGSVKRRKDSKKLYVDFYYFGHRIIRSTELDDSPANEIRVRDFLNRITERIETGTFKFAEAFPRATKKEKAFFTSLEGREYRPEPHQVLFGEYVKEWMKTVFPSFGSPTKHRDYQEAIKRILPYFRNMTFHQITGRELFRFTESLKWKTGVNKGKPVSRSRKVNILIPFRAIWNDACDNYRWVIKSPCDGIHKKLPKTEKKERLALRFNDWELFLENLETHYLPIAELMILTGMIVSEMSALTKESIQGEYLKLTSSSGL